MQERRLQMFVACVALFLLPCPAFRPLEYSATFGDLFLMLAIVLNLDQVFRIHAFQIPFLLALPFMMISQVLDADATSIEVAQTAYIYGVVIPFGWVAFCTVPLRYLVGTLVASLCASSLIGVAQNTGIIGPIARQNIWLAHGSFRAAGMSLSCSSLCMTLSCAYPLLLYVKSYRWRIICLVVLTLGLLSTLAKASVLAVPGLVYYLIREPNRGGVVRLTIAFSIVAVGSFAFSQGVQQTVSNLMDSLEFRLSNLDHSLWERSSTLRFALSYLPECYFIGLGYAGVFYELTQHLGNTVHVFHVGLPLIGGLICAVLHYIGIGMMCAKARHSGHGPAAMVMIAHLFAVSAMTVLMHSFQYVPYIMLATVISTRTTEQQSRSRNQHARAGLAYPPRPSGYSTRPSRAA